MSPAFSSSGNNPASPRPNDQSQPIRRPANPSTSASFQSRESASSVYIPPHRNGNVGESRKYSRDELLSIYHQESDASSLQGDVSHLFMNGWQPSLENGSSTSWPRRDDQREAPATVDVCWDQDGAMRPVTLEPLTEDELDLFNSVNSTIKPPPQSNSNPAGKDGHQREGLSRKLSNPPQSQAGNYGLSSPTSRPSQRRRDTSESYPFPPAQGPSAQGIANPPASLMRRRTDYQKDAPQDDGSKDTSPKIDSAPFATLKRSTTNTLNTSGNAWGAPSPSSAFSPIGGSFGSFAMNSPTATDKRQIGAARGESRFKSLMKDPGQDEANGVSEKPGVNSLAQDNWRDPRSARLPQQSGSNANTNQTEENTPPRQPNSLLTGFGMSAEEETSAENQRNFLRAFPQQTPLRREERGETLSPTNTNPYQSPEGDVDVHATNEFAARSGFSQGLPGLGGFSRDEQAPPFSLASGSNGAAGLLTSDSLRGIGMLPGLGTSSSPWGPGNMTATSRAAPAAFSGPFGDGLFSPSDNPPSAFGPSPTFGSSANPLGAFGQNSRFNTQFANNGRQGLGENGSPVQQSRIFDNQPLPPNIDTNAPSPFNLSDHNAGMTPVGRERPGSNGSNAQPPTQQVRTMVMPDRMKWEYKDHEGTTQGPFSGLEMHDWYKAGYFTPELQIKKIEDKNFEPLAHLIRRIGNSREPFLVPQIGVPHEPPAHASQWGPGGPGGIQPPFPNSFPSFGTTLTAEQQNDLERRKQESQYLMARQKEFLAQHQMKIQMGGTSSMYQTPPLNHQQSNQSLHSQPSFGNIASAGSQGAPPGQGQPTNPAPNNSAFRSAPGPPGQMDLMHQQLPSMMDRMSFGQQGQAQSNAPLGTIGQTDQAREDRANLQAEGAEADASMTAAQHNAAAQLAAHRLQQFHDLRAEHDAGDYEPLSPEQSLHLHNEHFEQDEEPSMTQQVQAAVSAKGQSNKWERLDMGSMQPIVPPPQSMSPMPAPVAQRKQNVADKFHSVGSPSPIHTPVETPTSSSIAPWAKDVQDAPKLSLKEIQEAEAKKAAKQEEAAAAARRQALERELAAQQQAAATTIPVLPGLPSTSNWASSPTATAAPAASVWSKATTGTRSTVTPSAPAKKTLQQIQKEEEARKQRAVAAAAAATANAPATNGQIPPVGLSSGKRYADLASKTQPVAPAPGGAWTTVGASGKAKNAIAPVVSRSVSGSVATATAPATRPKQPVRSTTLGATATAQQINKSANDALEGVRRWAERELEGKLKKGVSADVFVDSLLQIGLEPTILIEAVHAATDTLDTRHFTDEFVRRRKMADKGIMTETSVPPVPSFPPGLASSSSGLPGTSAAPIPQSGWSDVAKKPVVPVDNTLGSFKVVSNKKRSGGTKPR